MYLTIAIKLTIGVAALILVVRLLGKKQMSELTPFDFIYTLVLGGSLEEGLYDEKISLPHILFALAIWGILIYIIEILVQKVEFLKKPIKGGPSELMADGELNHVELKKNHIEMEQLRSMLREKGIFSLKDVHYILLETNGAISVIENTPDSFQVMPSVMVIDEGKIDKTGVKLIGKTKEWVEGQLSKENLHIKDVFYGEWSKQNGLYIKTYDRQDK